MTRRLVVAIFALQLGLAEHAQAALPSASLTTAATELAKLPEARLPAALVRQQIAALKPQPLRFAVPAALNLDQRNGIWDVDRTGHARWRLRIESDGASSLALRLSDIQLPEGAAMWFYDAAGRDVQGPFDRHSAGLVNGQISLPLVRNSSAVLEVLVPVEHRSEVAFKVVEAYHGYRDFGTVANDTVNGPKAAVGNESGTCNINVVCSDGNSWRDEIRSTVLLTIGNSTLCSGSLVSNTRQDDRPLILTANHCNIRSGNVGSVVAYFNVQSSTCNGNDDGRVDQNIVGSAFLARDEKADFTLFTLASTPPASFNVFYAGWDARDQAVPQSGVTIHHPSGDEKKISAYSAPATKVQGERIGDPAPGDGFNVDAWRVNWTRGTTEGGSSGSALWNQNKQVVGVLSGGGASCSTPGEPDFFGRLERGWTASSAASGQLKAHLDPINTGCLQLSSKNPGTASAIGACTALENGSGSFSLTALLTLLLGIGARQRFNASRSSRAGAMG